MKLDVYNHDRDGHGLRYVYPVVSRRAQGVSVGINLNPNNALPLLGVQLYGLARESQQVEAPRLSPLPEAQLHALAERLRAVGAEVRVSA